MERPSSPDAHESFERSAAVYDDHVAFNRAGARRLVASVPDGTYPRLLDVACGTGFAALAAIPRLGVRHVIGVDASAAMVDVFRERLAAHPGVTADLRACDVMAMDVPAGSVDVVLCAMALHWFGERAAAVALMARTLAPGGVLGVLAPGPEHDRETVERVRATGDGHLVRLADAIDANQVTPDALTRYMSGAGLEVLDVWTETRWRVSTAAAYGARLDAVASHLWSDLPSTERAGVAARLHALLDGASGPDGLYRYSFVKTFGVARAPGA